MIEFTELNRRLERGRNLALEHRQQEAMVKNIVDLAHSYQARLKSAHREALAIDQDTDLAQQGRQKRLANLTERTVRSIEALDPSPSIQAGHEAALANITNTVKNTRAKCRPEEKTLAFFQQMEIRTLFLRHRDEEKAKHEQRIATAKEPLSDQQRLFQDPIAAIFLDACKGYDPATGKQEAILSAVENSPIPLIDPATLGIGHAILERTLAKEHVEAKEAALVKLAMVDELHRGALDVARNLLRHKPMEGQRMPLSDQERHSMNEAAA